MTCAARQKCGNHGASEIFWPAIGGHCDVSLAREGKNIWRLRTPFYCAAARPRFRTAKTHSCPHQRARIAMQQSNAMSAES
jgi:hypothetical protein